MVKSGKVREQFAWLGTRPALLKTSAGLRVKDGTAHPDNNRALAPMPTSPFTRAECQRARCLPGLLVSAENVHENVEGRVCFSPKISLFSTCE